MNLNDLFLGKGIDPQHVLVLRHRPWEAQLNKVLPWLAAEKSNLFNAYQQTAGWHTAAIARSSSSNLSSKLDSSERRRFASRLSRSPRIRT